MPTPSSTPALAFTSDPTPNKQASYALPHPVLPSFQSPTLHPSTAISQTEPPQVPQSPSRSPLSPASTVLLTSSPPHGIKQGSYFPQKFRSVVPSEPDDVKISAPVDFPLKNESRRRSPPPQYSSQLASDLDTCRLTSAVGSLVLNDLPGNAPIPTVGHCLAHLQVLECFYNLREHISKTDGIFGFSNSLAQPMSQWDDANEVREIDLVQEKRWAVYVTRAVDRFEAWWTRCAPATRGGQPSRKLMQIDLDSSGGKWFEASFGHRFQMPFSAERLPPLDVLMVWHAYMLNPRSFAEDCLRLGKMDFWALGFPWEAINSAIDPSTLEYRPSVVAVQAFEGMTRRKWDSLVEPDTKKLNCAKCRAILDVPWTSKREVPIGGMKYELKDVLSSGEGFAESNFNFKCIGCNNIINHKYLELVKFKTDVESLASNNTPLPGTILSLKGIHDYHG
ncbi:uncharacterized protein BDR25DRAFT_394851 [Lindgomyces ingoldianus]|uniref:Uncharacterized protein n=1 Tax=Lindgomyces ingoldianus TaxID=673940 RepID=A0ACB6QQE1_9PLEO|nr:uncharacterized protein BDR25DRAFT_394851 [Lindgomyces ingoldianus]KAF2468381.1 hypothetical protein BDR25DRAFT_394851 [Lindgomyces ingoldianus]